MTGWEFGRDLLIVCGGWEVWCVIWTLWLEGLAKLTGFRD